MTKIIILFICVSFACFGSLNSASFECQFKTSALGNLGPKYFCGVQNSVSITSLDEAEVDDITGTHQAGYNNDNVEGFFVTKGQIHYFPRGLSKFFKNLKGIVIAHTGLKVIHQSDLKDFPKLMNLWLATNNLEILEKDLFEFNPNLNYIILNDNEISHIDPNVFDRLPKLKTLFLGSNMCIKMDAINNPTGAQNIIRRVKTQCTNSNYSNLRQKVINLEVESKYLNFENLKEKLEKLENEIKKSNFFNFFQESLNALKAVQAKKAQDEATTTTTTQEPTTIATTTTTKAPKKPEAINFETCLVLESKIDKIAASFNNCVDKAVSTSGTNSNGLNKNEQCAAIKKDLINVNGTMASLKDEMDTNMKTLEKNVENFKISALKEIQQIKTEVKEAYYGLMGSMNIKTDKIETKVEGIEEKLAKILKALKIDD